MLLLLVTFLGLAGISMVFGMLTSIASDLPQIENNVQFKEKTDSYLYDVTGKPIGVLAPPSATVLVTWPELSSNMNMVNAIVSVEDKRFWHSSGVDIRSLGRALLADVSGNATQGASTIPEEFVKNVLAEEDNRTVFEKLREAGIAYQLVHQWSKSKILTEYLNEIYFGNGATGVEAAARTYFGKDYGYSAGDSNSDSASACGDPDEQYPNRKECVEDLNPGQAAMLAGLVANPTAFDPLLHPGAAKKREDLVLQDMYAQKYITYAQYQEYYNAALPTSASQIQTPEEPSKAPYYVAWVRPLVIHALEQEGLSPTEAQYEAYYGGLKIKLALNLQMQSDAQAVVNEEFPYKDGPTASLVAINNANGEVEAMVSGNGDYAESPFNLATLGYRQPGSSFKMFTLAAALSLGKAGIDSIFNSEQINIRYDTPQGWSVFHVHNFDNAYDGDVTLATATKTSDNSVFAQLGWETGTQNVKSYAKKMGIRSSIDTYPAMILGGLTQGVSALDMAHAYETAATGGLKVYNTVLGDVNQGPVGIQSISGCKPCRQQTITNDHPDTYRELSPTVAGEIHTLLEGPVTSGGTGTRAYIDGADVVGKTGTTSNYADAWFVGWTPSTTVAVWVGYAKSDEPMETDFDGGPVEGGTYPAIIFHNFMEDALQIIASESSTTSTTSTTQETASESESSSNSQGSSDSESGSSSSSGSGSSSSGTGGSSSSSSSSGTSKSTGSGSGSTSSGGSSGGGSSSGGSSSGGGSSGGAGIG